MDYHLAKQLKEKGYGTHTIKTCSDCNKTLLLANKSYRCKPCQKLARDKARKSWDIKYYEANKNWILKDNVVRQKERRHTDQVYRENMLTKGHNRRAKIAGSIGTHTTAQWVELCLKHGMKCASCKRSVGDITLTRDHIIPISKGGSNDISNIQPLCISCNSSKKDKIND